jgi:hypothetical protein
VWANIVTTRCVYRIYESIVNTSTVIAHAVTNVYSAKDTKSATFKVVVVSRRAEIGNNNIRV